jgi:hypothetical protein
VQKIREKSLLPEKWNSRSLLPPMKMILLPLMKLMLLLLLLLLLLALLILLLLLLVMLQLLPLMMIAVMLQSSGMRFDVIVDYV